MEQYVVAIDFGTSNITAMIAKKSVGGKISVLRTEKTDSENCIRRGCIYNVDAAARKTEALMNRLNEDYAKPKLNAPIERAYVGIGGQSLHIEQYSITKRVAGETIQQQLLDEIAHEIKRYKPDLYEVLEILPPEYYVDGQLIGNPQGTTASSIEARFRLIVVSNPSLKMLIERAIPENVEIAGYIVAPLATAAAVLDKKEKELGCALVEFGAGITYVSIYKDGQLRYLVTIPLGGLVITRDIRCLNVSEEEAENLKKNYGSAVLDMKDETKITIDAGLNTEREIGVRNLNAIVEARMDEILANVIYQIDESGYADALSGIIITGGGAMLHRLEESFRKKTDKNIRLAYPVAGGTNKPAEDATIIGLLTIADGECVDAGAKVVQTSEQPEQSEQRTSFKRFRNKKNILDRLVNDLFEIDNIDVNNINNDPSNTENYDNNDADH
ncbi:MAG: cell division protein FtsA [Dysgonamonadaceae bacterium]|jgi:cell division protein FtsA|nr:cell division protein FtsA [Dysgonamonadaceae bacterium]